MLRKNKSTGKLERRNPDGTWSPLADTEGAQAVAVATGDTDAWAHLDQLFDEPATQADSLDGPQGTVGAGDGGNGADAAGAVDQGADAGGDVDVPGAGAGSGAVAVVAGPAPDGSAGDAAADDGGGPDLGGGPDAADRGLDEGPVAPDSDLEIDVPGLTSGDGKTGTGGQQGVLQRLRARRGVVAPGTVVVRTPKKVVVGERAASARGPAVRDSTESRLAKRKQGKGAAQTRFVPKPAPASLADQPKWVRDLFEAHFRSSRTLELRRSMNRMKLSRQDYAIGWMVMLEAARKEPSILRLKEVTE